MSRERIGLVGCVKSKRNAAAPAGDLYTSPLFTGRKRRVAANCSRWFILSAKHGLIVPDQFIEPYDETLTTKGQAARRAWSSGILIQLREVLGDIGQYDYEIHAGASYVAHGLRAGLVSSGANVSLPAEGLTLGQQLAFYRDDCQTGK